MKPILRKTSRKLARSSARPANGDSSVRIATPQHVRRQQTEAAVLASAEELFVQKGFQRTTVDEIAQRAGLTKGAVYVHFEDKRDLLLVLLRRADDRVLFPILKRLENPGTEIVDKLVDYIHSWARVAVEQRNTMFLPILMSFEFIGTKDPVEHQIADMYDRSYDALARVLAHGRQTGALRIEGDVRAYAASLVAFMDGLLLEWLRRGSSIDGSEMTRVARQMMLSGLARV